MDANSISNERAGKIIRAPEGYYAFLPSQLPPALDYSESLARILFESGSALGELSGVGRMLPNPYILIGPAIRREAVLSSKIEGTQSDLDDLYYYEAEPEESSGKSDVREVHNYVEAMEYGLQRIESFPISSRFFRELHERLMRGVRGEHATPGRYRTSQNWIGPPGCLLNEATYVPPPVEEMHRALSDLEKFLHAESDIPGLIRLALIHAQFEIIHPFIDGNGRIGRLLITLLLVEWGLLPHPLLYLSAFFYRHRDDYYRYLLRVSHEGDWESWIEFFLRGIREQSKASLVSAKRLLDLQSEYRDRLSGKRVTKITYNLLDQLFARPYITAPNVRDKWGVNYRTAERAINDLCAINVMEEITEKQRNRIWIAGGIMRALRGSK